MKLAGKKNYRFLSIFYSLKVKVIAPLLIGTITFYLVFDISNIPAQNEIG